MKTILSSTAFVLLSLAPCQTKGEKFLRGLQSAAKSRCPEGLVVTAHFCESSPEFLFDTIDDDEKIVGVICQDSLQDQSSLLECGEAGLQQEVVQTSRLTNIRTGSSRTHSFSCPSGMIALHHKPCENSQSFFAEESNTLEDFTVDFNDILFPNKGSCTVKNNNRRLSFDRNVITSTLVCSSVGGAAPTDTPTLSPTVVPTTSAPIPPPPTEISTASPSGNPSSSPTAVPTTSPTSVPTTGTPAPTAFSCEPSQFFPVIEFCDIVDEDPFPPSIFIRPQSLNGRDECPGRLKKTCKAQIPRASQGPRNRFDTARCPAGLVVTAHFCSLRRTGLTQDPKFIFETINGEEKIVGVTCEAIGKSLQPIPGVVTQLECGEPDQQRRVVQKSRTNDVPRRRTRTRSFTCPSGMHALHHKPCQNSRSFFKEISNKLEESTRVNGFFFPTKGTCVVKNDSGALGKRDNEVTSTLFCGRVDGTSGISSIPSSDSESGAQYMWSGILVAGLACLVSLL